MTADFDRNDVSEISERMRFRDLALQIKRFIKFARKGTSKEVLRREAREFHNRLSAFEKIDSSTVHKLQNHLESFLDDN